MEFLRRNLWILGLSACVLILVTILALYVFVIRAEPPEPPELTAGPAPPPAPPGESSEAEGPIVFDPKVDLPGWDDAFFDGDTHLWEEGIKKFEGRRDKLITPQKRDEWLDEWSQLVTDVEKKKEESKDNPSLVYLGNLERRLSQDRFFAKVEYRRVDRLPFSFFIQRPPKDEAGYYKELADFFTVPLRELRVLFETEYARPAGGRNVEKKKEYYPIAILASRGSYNNYLDTRRSEGGRWSRAHYDSKIPLIVTYEDTFQTLRNDVERLPAMLHEFVHALQHAHARYRKMPEVLWFNEGVADHVADRLIAGRRLMPDHGKRRQWELRLFVEMYYDAAGGVYVSDLRQLVSMGSYESAAHKAFLRARSSVPPVPFDRGVALRFFYLQSRLLVGFLHEGEGIRYRKGMMRYFRTVLEGKKGWSDFVDAFKEVADPDRLEREFFAHLRKEYESHWKDRRLPPKPVRATMIPAASGIRKPSKPAPEKTFDPGPLQWSADEWKEQLALTFHLASQSRLKDAVSGLRRFGMSLKRLTDSERVARELARLEELVAFREELLEEAGDRNLRVRIGQRRGKVESVDPGQGILRLQVDGTTTEIPLGDLTAKDLLGLAGAAGRKLEGESAWMKAYLALLGGESQDRVKRRDLRGERRGKAHDLKADMAVESYDELRALGRIAFEVEAIRVGRPPHRMDPAVAGESLERLKLLLSRHGNVDFIRRRKPHLRPFAESLVRRLFDPTSGDLGTRVPPKKLEDGRIHMAYDFEDSAQLDDFKPAGDYLAGWWDQFEAAYPVMREVEKSSFRIERGSLEGQGAACSRHILPLAPPFEITYQIVIQNPMTEFFVGICDDRFGNNLRCGPFGNVFVCNLSTNPPVTAQRAAQDAPQEIALGHNYTIGLEHDGSQLVCRLNGKVVNRVKKLGGLREGYIFFWLFSKASVRISSLDIRANLSRESLRDNEKKWVVERMKELGKLF